MAGRKRRDLDGTRLNLAAMEEYVCKLLYIGLRTPRERCAPWRCAQAWSFKWHADWCPPPMSRSAGRSSVQRLNALAQRG